MSLKEITPIELDRFIKSLRYIINNPKDNIMQEVFIEDINTITNSIRRIDRNGIVVTDIMRRLKTIQNLMDRFYELGYTFNNPRKFELARETVSNYLERYGHLGLYVETQHGYKERTLSEPTREFREGYEEEQYKLGYAHAIKKFSSGKWTPFVDEGRAKYPNIYFGKGVEDCELKMLGSKRGKWIDKKDVKELEAQAILDMCKDHDLLGVEGIRNILRYKVEKGENIQELSKSLLHKESSAKNELDRILENLSTGILLYEKKKQNEA